MTGVNILNNYNRYMQNKSAILFKLSVFQNLAWNYIGQIFSTEPKRNIFQKKHISHIMWREYSV